MPTGIGVIILVLAAIFLFRVTAFAAFAARVALVVVAVIDRIAERCSAGVRASVWVGFGLAPRPRRAGVIRARQGQQPS